MYKCNSGNHVWFNKADADKCCDPNWRRVLVIGSSGESNAMICEGLLMGRKWVRVEQPKQPAATSAPS